MTVDLPTGDGYDSPNAYLSDYVASPDLVGLKNVQITLTAYVDTGRPDQSTRVFRILTPKPVVSVLWTSKRYTLTLRSGNFLNPSLSNNVIDVAMKVPDDGIFPNTIRFEMPCDGTRYASDDGQGYIFIARQNGAPVFVNPGQITDPDPYNSYPNNYYYHVGYRGDLLAGNEEDYAALQPGTSYLHSWVQDIDVALVDATKSTTTDRAVYRRTNFSGT